MRKFEDYQETIEKACLYVMRKSYEYIDFDEYKSIGYSTFARLWEAHDELSPNAFRDLLYFSVRNDLYTFIKKEKRQLAKIYHCEISLRPETSPSPEASVCFFDSLSVMSEEAQKVAYTIFNAPAEIFDTVCPGPRQSKKDIKAWCRQQGWSWKTITSVFQELKGVV